MINTTDGSEAATSDPKRCIAFALTDSAIISNMSVPATGGDMGLALLVSPAMAAAVLLKRRKAQA